MRTIRLGRDVYTEIGDAFKEPPNEESSVGRAIQSAASEMWGPLGQGDHEAARRILGSALIVHGFDDRWVDRTMAKIAKLHLVLEPDDILGTWAVLYVLRVKGSRR